MGKKNRRTVPTHGQTDGQGLRHENKKVRKKESKKVRKKERKKERKNERKKERKNGRQKESHPYLRHQ